MAVPPNIRDHAYTLFTQEVPELLQAIESDLLMVRQERSLARIHSLMRSAHSIKGGAASVGLEAIALLAHRLENIFKALYSDALEIDTSLEGQLLQAYDCLRLPLMQQVVVGRFDAEQALVAAEPAFTQIEETLGETLKQVDHYDIPTSAQMGVDMTLSILEIDVSEQLERLTAAIATAQVDQIDQELRLQTQVLIELAEILNKPRLGTIAEVVLNAINTHPERVLEIAPLALENFQAYRETLLASNGNHEIAPSEDLLAWIENQSRETQLDSEHLKQNLRQLDHSTIAESGNRVHSDFELAFSTDTNTPLEPVENPTDSSIIDRLIAEETLRSLLDDIELEIEVDEVISKDVSETSTEAIFKTVPSTSELDLNSLFQITIEDNSEVISEATFETTSEITPDFSSPQSLHQVSTEVHLEDIPIAPQVTTRVDSEKLEQMNNLVNEAAIKRSSLSLHNEHIQQSVRDLLKRFATVEQIVAQLRKVSDRTLIPNPRQVYSTSETGNPLEVATRDNFDALELDNYGTLHSLLQEFLEDMIQLRESADDIALFARSSDKSLSDLKKSLNYLQDDFMWVRMLPIGEVLNRFPRILRDLSITYQKPVKLQLSGTEVLVDKAVIERIYDPLLHLLRNAFDHGIEAAEIRQQRGKPEQGLIEINAYHRGGQTVIEVKDDGAGLNLERISRRAIELGILSTLQLPQVPDDRLFNLIFEPGFSTAPQVNELSGRGVGLDVVRTQLSYLKGTISVTSRAGFGTTFTLRLPLTLTSDKLLICLAGFTALALPSDSIHEIFVPKADQVVQMGEQGFLHWRKEVFPIYRLTDLLAYEGPMPGALPLNALMTKTAAPESKLSAHEARTLIVIDWRQKYAALEVDQLITEQKLVIKPFGETIAPPHCVYGCTILGDGSVVPVVDGAALIDEALERNARRKGLPAIALPGNGIEVQDRGRGGVAQSGKQPTAGRSLPAKILVVEDAVSLRQTLTFTLEQAGYQVLQAGDGWEAIRQLQFNPDIALVISDIEMPNMNGFDLMNYRRQDAMLARIPIVILTSRSNDKHRRLAMHLGAAAYFTKPYLEQAFLKEIQSIVGVDRYSGNQLENHSEN